jgi:hypothetical protein
MSIQHCNREQLIWDSGYAAYLKLSLLAINSYGSASADLIAYSASLPTQKAQICLDLLQSMGVITCQNSEYSIDFDVVLKAPLGGQL